MNSFELTFTRIITASRSDQEAKDALDSWFRQLSDADYKRLIRGGSQTGRRMANEYLKNTEAENE